jgi:uncharacterized protein (TIGR02466 family)
MSNHRLIFYSFIDEEILNLPVDEIEEWCYYVKDNDKGKVLSNVGGWQSNNLDIHIPELKPLVSNILRKSEEIITQYSIPGKFYINPIWININGKKDFNMYHDHPRSILSGVFYIKTPKNCGDLVMINPMVQHQYYIEPTSIKEFNEFNSFAWPVTAETNKLVIFPSWIPHYTMPNLSDEDRISIAFNISSTP